MLKTIDKYLLKLRVTGLIPQFNVYRGQSNSKWTLRSSATRHLPAPSDLLLPPFLASYHNDILMKTRTGSFSIEHGRDLSDLQQLAELQHFGTPTGLLDFTWNPLVALWFASENEEKDGKLFSINTNNPGNVYRLFGDEANQDISKILSYRIERNQPPVAIWEPEFRSMARNRILVQCSVFVIGPPTFTKCDDIVSEVTIEKKDKKNLRNELDRLYINEQSLYRDVSVFGQARHSTKSDYTDKIKFNQGVVFFRQREFHSAVCIFDSLIKSGSDKDEYYLYRGITYVYLKNYIQAVQDLDNYICRVDSNHLAYHFRSIANCLLKEYDTAIKDSNSAIDIQPNNVLAYYNRGVSRCNKHEYEKVISDCDEAICRQPYFLESYRNRAFANYKLERYNDAIEDYTKVLQLDTENWEAYYGRACTYYKLEQHDFAKQDFEHVIELKPENAEAYAGRAYANKKLGRIKNYKKDLEIAYKLKPQLKPRRPE